MKKYVIAAFYKFVPLADYLSMKEPLLAKMREHGVFGTIILAAEGINGGAAGTIEAMSALYAYLHSQPLFQDLVFKETFDDLMPFEKAKVKFRKEIVTLGIENINPLDQTGQRLSPAAWNQLISEPEVLVIDTRNTYEVELGTFENAINPNTENFRDFPAYVEENLMDKKDSKIAMFCTGGIRCEKSTAYLMSLGFKNVYQLEGGILNYYECTPTNESLWQGQCFVFDERIAV